jgi:prepilin-type processing-associated H-X9-DG protein
VGRRSLLFNDYPADASVDATYGPRVRSISMNGYVSPGQAGSSADAYFKQTTYEKYLKSTDFNRLSPVNAFVFLDENPASLDDDWFAVGVGYFGGSAANENAANANYWDLPAVNHNGSSSFSFADGHGEIHHWIDGRTTSLAYTGTSTTSANNADCVWMATHATAPLN